MVRKRHHVVPAPEQTIGDVATGEPEGAGHGVTAHSRQVSRASNPMTRSGPTALVGALVAAALAASCAGQSSLIGDNYGTRTCYCLVTRKPDTRIRGHGPYGWPGAAEGGTLDGGAE